MFERLLIETASPPSAFIQRMNSGYCGDGNYGFEIQKGRVIAKFPCVIASGGGCDNTYGVSDAARR